MKIHALAVARAIAMDGHDTVTAQDGSEALEILTREQGAFDLCSPISRCRSWTGSRWRCRRRATFRG